VFKDASAETEIRIWNCHLKASSAFFPESRSVALNVAMATWVLIKKG
jgi:hypothetical protein